MIIGPDVSFYQDDNATPQQIDFCKMKANGAQFVIIRAGQNTWIDPDFAYNWQNAKEAGLPRGSYWYWDSRAQPATQAELWLQALGADQGELPMWGDYEEAYGGLYGGWQNFKTFLNCLKAKTAHEIGVYTRHYYFIEQTPVAEYPYFGAFPLWVANYAVETPRVPPAWTSWLFWQYTPTGDGIAYGAESKGIDLNYFNGDLAAFQARFHLTPAPPTPPDPGEEHTEPYPGVEYWKVKRFGTWAHIAQIGSGAKFHVTKFGLKKVSTVARELGAQVATNGGDYNAYHAVGLHASEGVIYQPVMEYEPFVNMTQASLPQVKTWNATGEKWNALAGKRMLVENGARAPNTSAAWAVPEPRTLAGVDAQSRLVLAVVDGRQVIDGVYTAGIDLYQAAALMIEFGCIRAIDLDGGGSSAMWLTDRIVNVPIDDNIPGQERAVGTHIAAFVSEPIPAPMQYRVVWAKGASVKPAPNTGGVALRVIPCDAVVDVYEDQIPDSVYPADPNRRWCKVSDGYAATNYPDGMGVPQVRMEKVGVIPVPTTLASFEVLRDQFTKHWNYQVRPSAPAPAVFRTGEILDNLSYERAHFTEAWQWYAYDLLALAKYGKKHGDLSATERAYINQKFTSLYASNRAFTNKAGVDICNNYPLRITNRGKDPLIDPFICAGNTVWGTIVTNSKGVQMVRLASYRPTSTPPAPSLKSRRVLIARIIQTDGRLTNFPQLGGIPVPYPYIAVEPYYYPLQELKEL